MAEGDGAGRPIKLTPEIQTSIAALIRNGNYIVDAAAVAGVPRQTLYDWITRGLEEGEGDPRFEFAKAMERARAEAVAMRIGRISQAGKDGTWQADAWWLERVDPERWGRRGSEVTVNIGQSPQWLELKAKIVAALRPYPEAAAAVAAAIEGGTPAIDVKALPEAD